MLGEGDQTTITNTTLDYPSSINYANEETEEKEVGEDGSGEDEEDEDEDDEDEDEDDEDEQGDEDEERDEWDDEVSYEVSTSEEEEIAFKRLGWRDKLFLLMSTPNLNFFSFAYTFTNFAAIVISTITFLISTLPAYHDTVNVGLDITEIVVIVIFTFDYLARLILTRQNRILYFVEFMNMVDFFAILPFYVEMILSTSGGVSSLVVLRLLRLIRVVRILKLIRYSKELPVVLRATKASRAGFGLAIFSITLFVILWASAMYYAELSSCTFDPQDGKWKYDDGRPTYFQSIPHTLWWTIVTMTTVGYGDEVPFTTLGKVVGSGAIVSGILVLAFPLTILAGNFNAEYNAFLTEQEIKEGKKLEKERKKRYQRNVRDGKVPTRRVSHKKLIQEIWGELLRLRGELDSTKSVIGSFERQFTKIDLYVEILARAMANEEMKRKEEEGTKRKRLGRIIEEEASN